MNAFPWDKCTINTPADRVVVGLSDTFPGTVFLRAETKGSPAHEWRMPPSTARDVAKQLVAFAKKAESA